MVRKRQRGGLERSRAEGREKAERRAGKRQRGGYGEAERRACKKQRGGPGRGREEGREEAERGGAGKRQKGGYGESARRAGWCVVRRAGMKPRGKAGKNL